MPYRVRVTSTARDEIEGLPGNVRQRVRRLIDGFAADPRPPRTKELRDRAGRYRLPLEDWRIIYEVDDEDRVVVILTVRRKRGPETYEGLD